MTPYNKVALHIVANPMFHKFTKHIELICDFIHENIQARQILASFSHYLCSYYKHVH